jgi:hypothetical protein
MSTALVLLGDHLVLECRTNGLMIKLGSREDGFMLKKGSRARWSFIEWQDKDELYGLKIIPADCSIKEKFSMK